MLTASDFILILMELHRNRATLTDEQLEVHTISAWKEGKSQQYGEAIRVALMFGRPLIWASHDESLKDVALMILQNRISTVPIIYSTIEESCPLLLHFACLGGILKYICRHFKNHLYCLPILRQLVSSLPLGTWKSEAVESLAHLLALRPSETLSYALNILIEDSDVDCILNCDSESVSIDANNPEAYLHLPIVNSKLDRFSLLRNLPSMLNFAKINLRRGKKLLVCCNNGKCNVHLPFLSL
ncbi:Sucrose nonfermenting 4-like protein [Camellia lanceoleosa]|uniref:Sucrose nonfermenting 4-like protein n=1 Tax=Camellia lanceoleosa TaxID=1840588 RepID=A0ACC0GE26_9ERIC|nr:Sucrose nonfermenting 4-like protein [Camellia lanceoleosa]